MILCEASYTADCILESTGLEVYTEGFGESLKAFITKIVTAIGDWFKKMWAKVSEFFAKLFKKSKDEDKQIDEILKKHEEECKKGAEIVLSNNIDVEKIQNAIEVAEEKGDNKSVEKEDGPKNSAKPNSQVQLLAAPSNKSRIVNALSKLEGNSYTLFAKDFDDILRHLDMRRFNSTDIYFMFSRDLNVAQSLYEILYAKSQEDFDKRARYNIRAIEDERIYNFHAAMGKYRTPLNDDEDVNSSYVYSIVYNKFIESTNNHIGSVYKSYEDIKSHIKNDSNKIYKGMHENTKKRFKSAFKTIDSMKFEADKFISLLMNEKKSRSIDSNKPKEIKIIPNSIPEDFNDILEWNNISIKSVQKATAEYYNAAKKYLTDSEQFFLARDRAILKAIKERRDQAKEVLNLCYAMAGLDINKDTIEESSNIFSNIRII